MNPSGVTVIMATVNEEGEDEIVRFLDSIHLRLVKLLMLAENYGSRQDRADYIIKNLISEHNSHKPKPIG